MTSWAPFERYGDSNFADSNGDQYNMNILGPDQFFLNLQDYHEKIYSKHIDCVDCPYVEDYAGSKMSTLYLYKTINNGTECFYKDMFGEFGVYNVYSVNCTVEVMREPVNIYFPLLSIFIIYALLSFCVYRIFLLTPKSIKEDDGNIETEKKKKRMKSLDTFRGLTILLMIVANFGAGKYYYFEHAPWNGLHVADLVFPWFVWIMGAVIPIILPSKLKQGNKKIIFMPVLQRSVLLFCLGVFLNGGSNLKYIRIMGVLQRLGIGYLVATTILIFLIETDDQKYNQGIKAIFKDILVLWKSWIVALGILALHCVIIFLVHDTGCPSGYMGPGGIHKNSLYFDCVGGATGLIDRSILRKSHVYRNSLIQSVYQNKIPFEPEGLLGCLTTIFHVFIGVQAGSIYTTFKNKPNGHWQILIRWLSWALFTGLLGGILCGFSKEDGIIPVNKNLWSLSFVLVTSCFAFLMLSLLYYIIDYKSWWSGKPIFFAGMNAIVLYAGHELTDGHFPIRIDYSTFSLYDESSDFYELRNTHFGELLTDIWGAVMWLLIAYIMYKKKIFVTL